MAGDRVPNYELDSVVTSLETAAVNGVLTITVKAEKGNIKVIVEGDETGNVKYDATAEELQTALNKLGSVDLGDITVTGGPGDENGTKPYNLALAGQYAGANVPTVTTDVSGLEEGTKTADVAVKTVGSDAVANPNAVKRGTGLADRTGDSSPLAGESPVEVRENDEEELYE